MFPLLLAIACSASIALVFKRSESTNANRYAVTSVNYAAAATVSAILIGLRGWPSLEGASLGEIAEALGDGARLDGAGSALWAILAGLGAGTFFFGGFIFYQLAVREHGVTLAGAFIKLGALLPASLALILWREIPTHGQAIGTVLAVAAILLAHGKGASGAMRPLLLLLFLVGGLAEFSTSVFERHGRQADKDLFLLATFGTALVASLVALVLARHPVTLRDLLIGVAVGLPNLGSSWFLIEALDTVKPAVAFPVMGAGTILVLVVAGTLIYGERHRWTEWLAVAVTIGALVALSL